MSNFVRLIARARGPSWLRQDYRALAAYYRAGGAERPNHALTGRYMVSSKTKKNKYTIDSMQY